MRRTTALFAATAFLTVGAVNATSFVAEEKPGVPASTQESPGPKGGETLQPGIEKRLRWGEPANGLRAALMIRPVPGEPKAGDMPDLYLVVQNVSRDPIRLDDTTEAPDRRSLYLKIDGKIQLLLGIKESTVGDVTLRPREVAYMTMLPPDSKDNVGRRVGSVIAEGTLKDTHQTMVAEMKIDRAPTGVWTGKLVTGETSGAVAAGRAEIKKP